MQFLRLDFKKIFSITTFLGACGIIYTLQQSQVTPRLPLTPSFITNSLQPIYNQAAESISSTVKQYMDLMSIREELLKLKVDNQALKAQLQVFDEVRAENDRLKSLFNLKDQHPKYQFIVAKVTAKDLFSDHYSLTISKGSEDGVEKLSGVISGDGVIGYVIDVQPHTSRLLLISDRLISIDATVQRTRGRGIISGQSRSESVLKFIDRPQEITTGDLIVTSDDQKIFPIGYPIGHVTSVQVSPFGVGHTASVKPTVDLRTLDEVIVLKALKQ
jgi:rod shape-determining protein MreC